MIETAAWFAVVSAVGVGLWRWLEALGVLADPDDES